MFFINRNENKSNKDPAQMTEINVALLQVKSHKITQGLD